MININLLPAELKMKRISAKRNATLISICIVLTFLTAAIGIVARSFSSTVETNLREAREKIEKNTSSLDQYQDLREAALFINDREKTAQDLAKKRIPWSKVLLDLINSTPIDVQFENLTINTEKTPNFVLQGNTTTEREIIKFKDKLENSDSFEAVTFKSSSLTVDAQNKTEKLKFTLEFNLQKTDEK